ncbi:MAG TPA: PHP domain-containing protein, partial [Polyangiales bacterium]|nr:PHP domain-containing protein [Polyangiales bacterium]
GLEYIAITDHTRDLPMTGGQDEERLLAQLAAIRKLDARQRRLRVLAGAELNIRRDGSLDIADAVLAQLDVVGAGVHSHFHLPRREMTARLIRAMENPHVDILLHPTARLLGRRPALDLDMPAVFEAARRTGTALEIDAQPDRLDLAAEHVRQAIAHGVKLVISSDAHSARELRYANELGIGVARRGWATRDDVLNTQPVQSLLSWFGRARSSTAAA